MDNPNPLKPFIRPETPDPIEGILPGMRFLETKLVLKLHQAGNVMVTHVFDTYVIGQYRPKPTNLRKKLLSRKFWKLDNGLLVRFKLDPSTAGYGCSEPGVYRPGGPVQITGRYPVYFTDAGDRVWITADGNFVDVEPSNEPGNNFIHQMRVKYQRNILESQKRTKDADLTERFTCPNCGTIEVRKRRTKIYCSTYCRVRHNLDKKAHGL